MNTEKKPKEEFTEEFHGVVRHFLNTKPDHTKTGEKKKPVANRKRPEKPKA